MATHATALNERGQVVGYSFVRDAVPHRGSLAHAFLYENGRITDLFPTDDVGFSVATAINESGQIVGRRHWDDMSPSQPFVWEATQGPTILNPFGAMPVAATGAANGINDGGDVVGGAATPSFPSHAFRLAPPWATGAATDLTPSLAPPYQGSTAVAVNDSGHAVGTLSKPGYFPNTWDTTDSFYYDGSSMTPLDGLVPGRSFQPQTLNDAGIAVGFAYNGSAPAQAFTYASGSMTELVSLTPGGSSRANGINAVGDVVGNATTSNGDWHAVLWNDVAIYDLNDFIPNSPGVVLTDARAINDTGQVVAWGYRASEPSLVRSFLLTPATPSEAIEDLIDLITGLGLPKGIENSLVQKLQNARAALQAGDIGGACDLLGAFINEVEAQAGKKIDADDAARATLVAGRIRAAVGCDAESQVAAPELTPAGGLFSNPVTVAITTATPDSTIRYATDGLDPTEASALYTEPLVLSTTTELRARAFKTGWIPSASVSALYQLHYGTLEPPAISPEPGTYETAVEISQSSPPGASVHYTTDGATPTTASPVYAGPFALTASATVRAASFQADWTPSPVAEAAYEIQVATPAFSPEPGHYSWPQDVAISSSTPGATIAYTTDGTDPTESDPTLAAGETVQVDRSLTLRARAWKAGLTPSAVADASYTIPPPRGRIAAGRAHLLYVRPDRRAWAWGEGDAGQLGNGGTEPASDPVQVQLDEVVEVAAGGRHSLARRTDGSVWSFGDNTFGQTGRAPGGTSLLPAEVAGLSGVKALAAGESHSLALTADGRVWSWGGGSQGQLGNGTNADSGTPAVVEGLSDVIQIAAGAHHSLALRSNGSLWAWGAGELGQVGDDSWEARNRPTQVAALERVIRIAAGDTHSLAVTEDGSLWGWGQGNSGQLGSEVSSPSNVPIPVTDRPCWDEGGSAPPILATFVDGGLHHSVGLLSDPYVGALGVWSWGYEGWELCDTESPLSVVLNEDVTDLSSAGTRNLALSGSGELWYWEQTATGPGVPVTLTESDGTLRVFPPVFSLASGTYRTEQMVTVTAPTPGSTIHYTTDGSWPDETASMLLSGSKLPITLSTELQAVAYLPGRPPSDVRWASYVLKVMDPVLTPPPSGFDEPVEVTLTVETPQASLRYALDGLPTDDDPALPSGTRVTLTPPTTVYVRGYRDGWEPSQAFGTYRSAVVTPVLTPPGGSFTGPVTVTVTTTTPGATLRYSTDGFEPNEFDPAIASGATIRIERSTTLAVKGWRDDLGASDTLWGTYRFALPAPTLHERRPRSATGALYLTGATSVPQATVRCTTDGSEPTAISPICTRPTPVDVTTTVKAKAFAFGWEPSATTAKTYAVEDADVATPILSLPSGSYPAAQPVSISCSTLDATIHYTITGSDPTPDDPVIVSGDTLLVDSSLTLKARAWRGAQSSLIRRADYALTGSVTVPAFDSAVIALKTDGSVWGFGPNERGQIGNGAASTPVTTPSRSLIDDVIQIASGRAHTVALRRDGSVFTWGTNEAGQLGTGQGTALYRATPESVGLTDIVAVAAGGSFSAALGLDGHLWTWGQAYAYSGSPPEHYVPQLRTDVRCARAFALDDLLVCVDRTGEAWRTSGPRNPFEPWPGYRGLIDLTYSQRRQPLFTEGGVKGGLDFAPSFLASRIASDLYLAERAIPWGVEYLDGAARWVVAEAAPAVTIARSSVVKADGTLWRWGDNRLGQLGNGTTVSRQEPNLVPDFALFNDTWLLEDPDADGLSNVEELDLGTDPYLDDTNQDGVSDGLPVGGEMDPVSVDVDGDGLTNAQEAALGTNPLAADSDADGVADGADVFPLDPARSAPGSPDPSDTTPPHIQLVEPANAVFVSSHP